MKNILSWIAWLNRECGLRFLARRRAAAAVAVLMVALALGANTLVLAIARAFVMTSFAMPDADRLLVVAPVRELPGRGEVLFAEAYSNYARMRETQRSFSDLAVLWQLIASWDAGETPMPLEAARVSASFFTTTRVQPALGRAFVRAEEGPNAARVVILGHALWRSGFAGDPGVLGRSIGIDGEQYTIVGVMPEGFVHPLRTELWLPFDLGTEAAWTAVVGARSLAVYGRLRDDATLEAARAEMVEQTQRSIEASAGNRDFRYTLQPIREVLVPGVGRVVLFVQSGAALLALLAVSNLASLLIAWGFDRRQELAVRLSLGASRGRVMRMLVLQSVFLIAAGGSLGVVLTHLALPLVRSLEVAPALRYFFAELRADGLVLGVAAGSMAVAGIAAGLLPALLLGRGDLAGSLRSGSRTVTLSSAAIRWQQGMVAVQSGLAVVILSAAILIGISFRNLGRVPIGFTPESKVVARVQLSSARYASQTERAAFGERLIESLGLESELTAYGFTSTLPVSDPGWGGRFYRDPGEAVTSGEPELLHFRRISDRYPEAMGMPLLSGRLFDARDRADGVQVAIISQALARRLWPDDDDVIGKRLYRVLPAGPAQAIEIVGVIGNMQDGGLNAPAGEAVYVPWPQVSVTSMSIVVRWRTDADAAIAAVRRAVAASDPVLAASNTASLSALVSQANALPRLQTILLTLFALVALLLLLLGSYGVMMQLVLSREREYALRLLFGARPGLLAASVLAQIARLSLLGAAAGTILFWLMNALLEPLAFGIAPRSMSLLGLAGVAILGMGAIAAIAPAARVLRADVRSATLPD